MMQSRGRIALSTRQRSLWIWEKVKFEWGQAFQVGVSMITKILPRFLPERERCDPEEGLSRLQPSRAHGFALLCYADQKPKYDSRGRGPFSGCPAPETPSFEEFLAPESYREAEPTPSPWEVYVLDTYFPSLSCSKVWHLTQSWPDTPAGISNLEGATPRGRDCDEFFLGAVAKLPWISRGSGLSVQGPGPGVTESVR